MATTITPVANSGTPYSLKLALAGNDGAAGLLSYTALLAALPSGPLKAAISRTLPSALAEFNVDGVRGDEIRIYSVALAAATALQSGARTIAWVSNADPAVAGLACTLVAANTTVIEIRLNHSTQA
jgi:hypothetical protein